MMFPSNTLAWYEFTGSCNPLHAPIRVFAEVGVCGGWVCAFIQSYEFDRVNRESMKQESLDNHGQNNKTLVTCAISYRSLIMVSFLS